ncbi:SHOCT domain-containing protein [Brachybacterium subflavum]|uniref:SHOCT domain-containing protein n=1 Tax=Brachybacterium subflavum TaxID=2585206 RepID=UPI001D0CF33F|nr:SHOCT domain-containing protein [Brachybacterium subflavum]
MEPEITDRAKSFNTGKKLAKRTARLQPGEVTFFIGYVPGVMAGFDSFYLTTLGFAGFNFSTPDPRFMYGDVIGYDDTEKGGVVIHRKGGAADITIPKLDMVERLALKAALETFPRLGPNNEAWQAWVARRKELTDAYMPTQKEFVQASRQAEVTSREERTRLERGHQEALKARAATKTWPNTRLPNGPPNKASGLTILQHCHDSEEPWFILTSFMAGCMACFDDRLMIVKGGNMQGYMAGTMFGSRSTTFYYHDINAIEFNKQLLGSVLEVLTSSYQGTANHDYWRGSNSSRNADAGSPWTLSNTLPINNSEYTSARAEMSELRQRIAAAKQTSVNITMPAGMPTPPPPAAPADDLVSRLAKLGELRDAGVLTDEEFQTAKTRLLAGPNA